MGLDFLEQLLKISRNHLFFDVGASYGDYSLFVASHGWIVTAFEMNPQRYSILVSNIHEKKLEKQITPILTKITLKNPLDHFIDHHHQQHVGLVRIDLNGQELEILDGLKYSLQNHLIDNLIVKIHPNLIPTYSWLKKITELKTLGFYIYELSPTQNIPRPIEEINIHQMSENLLLFLNSDLNQLVKNLSTVQ